MKSLVVLSVILLAQSWSFAQGTLEATSDSDHVKVVKREAKIKAKGTKPKSSKKGLASNKKSTQPAKTVTGAKPATKTAGKKSAVAKTTPVAGAVAVPVAAKTTANTNATKLAATNTTPAANPYAQPYSNSVRNSYNPYAPNSLGAASAPALSTKVKTQPKEEAFNRFSLTIVSYNAQDLNALENAGGNGNGSSSPDYTIRAWEHIQPAYYFTKDLYLYLDIQFQHTWWQDQDRSQSSSNPGLRQSYAAWLRDTGIILKDGKLGTLGSSGLIVGGVLAYYAPTSEASQTAGQVGDARTELSLARSIGKWDFKWKEQFRYYIQQYETNAYLKPSGMTAPNVNNRLFSLLDIGFNITSALSIGLEGGIVNEAMYADSFNGTPAVNNVYFDFNPEIDYSFSKTFQLALGIWDMYNSTNQPTGNGGNSFAYYSPVAPENANGAGPLGGSEIYIQGTLKF